MVMKVSEARTRVSSLLDDEDQVRWAAGTGNLGATEKDVDVAIIVATEECISEYVASGGERLDTIFEVTTDSDGLISLSASSKTPLVIKTVSVKSGSKSYPIRATRRNDVQNSAGAETLRICAVLKPTLSSTPAASTLNYAPSDHLVWDTMDAWICATAAKHLLPKDAEANAQLDARIGMLRSAAIREVESPAVILFPSKQNTFDNFYQHQYRWSYISHDDSVSLADKKNIIRLHRVWLG